MKIRKTKLNVVCDLCLEDNVQKKAIRKCLFCGKDFCSQHGYELIKMIKIRKYNYKKELKALICDYCSERIVNMNFEQE